jgi:hypothetical protein
MWLMGKARTFIGTEEITIKGYVFSYSSVIQASSKSLAEASLTQYIQKMYSDQTCEYDMVAVCEIEEKDISIFGFLPFMYAKT